MAELSESATAEIEVELLGRQDFDGAIVVATLGEDATYDAADVYFSTVVDAGPLWRALELLTAAKARRERGVIPEPLE